MRDFELRARHKLEEKTSAKVKATHKSGRLHFLWTTAGPCAKGDACILRHDLNRRNEGKVLNRSSSPSKKIERRLKREIVKISPQGNCQDGAKCEERQPPVCTKVVYLIK